MPDRHLPIRGACGARPGGVPLRAWFDGILDLPAGDIESVREAVARINRVGYTKLDWDLEGGRVSLLADDTPIPPARMKESIRSDFLRAMEGLMEVLPPEGARESTLRCVEVYQEEVRETLFVPEGRTIRAVSRLRPTVEHDRVGTEDGKTIVPVASYGRGRLILLGVLFFVLGALLVWRGRYLDRILSPRRRNYNS